MKVKLYHYVHCPFCIRIRITLGFLNIPYESIVLPYNDEKTPILLSGIKMLPIIEIDGKILNESLDIIRMLDKKNLLNFEQYDKSSASVEKFLTKISGPLYSLCMPYWIWTPEFDETSRHYFQTKKEIKRGPFNKLIQNKEIYLKELNESLMNELEKDLTPFYQSEFFSVVDIMIASHLWGMFIFPEFRFSEKIHNYLIGIKELAQFEYHRDFFRGP